MNHMYSLPSKDKTFFCPNSFHKNFGLIIQRLYFVLRCIAARINAAAGSTFNFDMLHELSFSKVHSTQFFVESVFFPSFLMSCCLYMSLRLGSDWVTASCSVYDFINKSLHCITLHRYRCCRDFHVAPVHI